MNLLAGHKVLATAGMRERPLARYLVSLGAQLMGEDVRPETIPGASFLIEDVGLVGLQELGLSRSTLERLNPGLVHVSVTAFGSSGPRAHWRGSELVVSATGGVLRLTGEPDRPPVKEALDACMFHADMAAAAGAMAAHYSRGATGLGQHVDISAQEVTFSRIVNSILVWQFDRRKLHRVGGAVNYGKATVRCIWQLADGWCFHTLMTGKFGAPANRALSEWMDEVGARNPMREVDWLQYNRSTLPVETRAEWEGAMAEFFACRTRAEMSGEGRRRGINACVVAAPEDVIVDSHLEERGFWAGDGERRRPGRFAAIRAGVEEKLEGTLEETSDGRSGGTPGRCEGPTQAVPGREAALAAVPASRRAAPAEAVRVSGNVAALAVPASRRRGPLAGVRVLDFSWALVGSITTKILGDLGADVIKVESRGRPCLSRIDVQVAASKAGDFDDKPWFAHLNTSKRSLALDLKRREAFEVLYPLVDWADVVVENFSPGTMAKLGLDYDTLARRNPALVMVSGSVYGQTGPLAQEWGVDGTGAALSGRTYLTGWPDRGPVMPGAVPYGDVIVPYVMAATVSAALEHRRRCGVGAYIDAAMYEICVQQMYDAVVAACAGNAPRRSGNADFAVFWQGVVPASGEDRWVAITVADEHEWQRLQSLTRGADVASWSVTRPDHVLVEILQGQGIAAGVVQDIEDLFERDPGILARRALIVLEHARLGAFGHVRTPIDFSRDTNSPFRTPSIGEHSLEVAREVARVVPERLAELQKMGVFT